MPTNFLGAGLLAACLATTTQLPAQVPNGWYVVSSFQVSGGPPGGLHLVHPRLPGPPIAVQGLSSDLTGSPGTQQGANCVAIERATGLVLVGELGPTGTAIEVHRLAITGDQAVTVATYPIGVSTDSASGVHSIAMLPDGDAILGVSGIASQPPTNGALLLHLSVNTGTLTPIATNASFRCNAIAHDPSSGGIYFSDITGIRRVALSGGISTLVNSQFALAASLAVASNGRIYATSGGAVLAVDPVTGASSQFATVGANINAMTLEIATDQLATALNGLGSGPGVHWISTSGTPTLLTTGIAGVCSGIAVNDSPRAYGDATDGTMAYRWQVTPCPGGLPTLGNSNFGLLMSAVGPTPTPGFLFGSLTVGNTQLAGVRVLLDPANMMALTTIAPGVPLSLPIPATLPANTDFYFQAVFLDAGAPTGLAASNGQFVGPIR